MPMPNINAGDVAFQTETQCLVIIHLCLLNSPRNYKAKFPHFRSPVTLNTCTVDNSVVAFNKIVFMSWWIVGSIQPEAEVSTLICMTYQ